ncbi:hypothetical protein ACOMHN_011028 [Nucella lapillus]
MMEKTPSQWGTGYHVSTCVLPEQVKRSGLLPFTWDQRQVCRQVCRQVTGDICQLLCPPVNPSWLQGDGLSTLLTVTGQACTALSLLLMQ